MSEGNENWCIRKYVSIYVQLAFNKKKGDRVLYRKITQPNMQRSNGVFSTIRPKPSAGKPFFLNGIAQNFFIRKLLPEHIFPKPSAWNDITRNFFAHKLELHPWKNPRKPKKIFIIKFLFIVQWSLQYFPSNQNEFPFELLKPSVFCFRLFVCLFFNENLTKTSFFLGQ